MKSADERKQIGVKIDPQLWWELRALAFQKGTTATDLLHNAMREYIDRHSDRPPGRQTRR